LFSDSVEVGRRSRLSRALRHHRESGSPDGRDFELIPS
jgi:hypothetical protein